VCQLPLFAAASAGLTMTTRGRSLLLDTDAPIADAQRMRHAGAQVLSLALMDARNHTLRWLAAYERALGARDFVVPQLPELNPPLWEAGHIGWFQEWWIGRNLQRPRGRRADPTATRLASIEPNADRWYDSSNVPHDTRWKLALPDAGGTRQYLVETLESTLELLEVVPDDEDDDALYLYRLALFHEDMHGEAFAYMAQTLGIDDAAAPAALGTFAPRDALWFPPTRWMLGSDADARGFSFDNERGAHEIAVPEFEIDAQPVTWGQYVEFVDDGGYDDPRWWTPEGWAWVEGQARRCPRHVEQLRGGVLARRGAKLARVPLAQPAMHVSWHEADAWCRWAGRRLPTEVEWELAAHQGGSRGFRWGDVWEWTATTFRPYPGFGADPYRDYSAPWFGTHKVLRGASFATRARMKHPKYRNFYLPQRDDVFVGFRSCAG
jgi:ergothioneine biosynthesis protein EgtB